MTTHSRNNFKWGVQEILSLQREFQLLKLSIDEIAKKHKRTPNAIMLKLDKEGMANYNALYIDYYKSSDLIPDEIKMEIVSQDGSEYNEEEVQDDDDSEYEEEDDDDSEYKEEEYDEYDGDDDDEDEDPLSNRVAKLERDIKEILQTLKDLSSKIKA